MNKTLYKYWSKFLTWFGNVKIFKRPLWFVVDPDTDRITGSKVLEIMEVIKPGDVILRGYDRYLDSKFIPDPLKYSHGALYVGNVKDNDKEYNNCVIHAIAKGVSIEDIIEFTRCDRIAIFRPSKYQKRAISRAKSFLKDKIEYDFGFNNGISALYCFELCAKAYDKLSIKTKVVKKFFGLVKKDIYLAESFFESPDFECIFQYNPKFNIDFRK